ncbi:MAG: DUF1800 domain-containing protein [Planctomycetaceae bacterium]|nr:DUF1800 domain-containing protein [Planctomycetaceae bacterium]
MNNWHEIDPMWAWEPFSPPGGKLTREHVAHLHRRTCLGATISQIEMGTQRSVTELVDELIRPLPEANSTDPLAQATLATGNARKLSAWWVYRLLTTDAPCREVMTLFWHGHFATSADKVTNVNLMYRQNELLREYAFEDFGKLVQEISHDSAMLIYLDSVTNRKAHPNENYAREVMELFCLGEGNYTETDIRELARCFTGWEVRREKFRFNRYQHDSGEKTVFGKTGPWTGEQGVDIVLEQAALPRFLVSKLIHYFLADEVDIPEKLIEPLAKQLRDDGLQIGPTLKRLLSSNLFFSKSCVAAKVRSPVTFAIGLLRSLEGTADTIALAEGVGDLGQDLFFPPNVKGWDGGRAWINSSTLLARANLIRRLLDHENTRFAKGSLAELASSLDRRTGTDVINWWEATLLATPLRSDVREQLVSTIENGSGNRDARLRDALHLFCALPEYQLA